jgi:glycolate oxidase iron-sulfur subunit
MRPVAAMLALAPPSVPGRSRPRPSVHPARVKRTGRVAILSGCAQQVLDPGINEAAIALLTRLGTEVVTAAGEGCCGALVHHMGREARALADARRNIDAWTREIEKGGLDAILVTASGCGTTVKDYGHMLRFDADYADRARRVSALALDISEYLSRLSLPPPAVRTGLTVAYHSACSLQHGQKVTREPRQLLEKAGFTVREPAEGHLCCGSAGTYNILQDSIAERLGERKARNLERTGADIVAAGNIGCITQIASGIGLPVVHTVRLIDWAYGGARPEGVPAAAR